MRVIDLLRKHCFFDDRKFWSSVFPVVRLVDFPLDCSSTRFYADSGIAYARVGVFDVCCLDKDVESLSHVEKLEFGLVALTLEHEKQHVRQLQQLYQSRDFDVDMFKDFLVNDANGCYGGLFYAFSISELDAYKESVLRAREWVEPLLGDELYSDLVVSWYGNFDLGQSLTLSNIDCLDDVSGCFDETIGAYHNNVGIENCDVNSLGDDLIKRFIEASDDNKLLEFVMKHPNENSKQRDLLAGMAVAYNPLYSIWFPFVNDEDVMGHDFIHWKHYCENNMPRELEQERKPLLDKVDSAVSKRNSNRISNVVSKLPLVGKVESVLDDYGLE